MSPTPKLRRATFIRAAPEVVYALIATADGLDSSFTSGASLDPRPGGELVYRWKDWGPDRVSTEARGTVHETEPPPRFVFDWNVGHAQRATAEFEAGMGIESETFIPEGAGGHTLLLATR